MITNATSDDVSRYFHIRVKGETKGGATVLVTGERDGGLESEIQVSIAYCSPKDPFSRKTGRLCAGANPNKTMGIPLKGLPGLLHKVSVNVVRKHKGMRYKYVPRCMSELWLRDWSFATKYWCPKDEKPVAEPNPPAQATELERELTGFAFEHLRLPGREFV